jgi:hypothetical protein
MAAALDPLLGDAEVTTGQVLDAVLGAYNQASGEELTAATLDKEASPRLRLYLVEAEMSGEGPTLFHRPRVLGRLPLYADTASKLSVMLQRGCDARPDGNEFPPSTFPIGVPPWSHQCAASGERFDRRSMTPRTTPSTLLRVPLTVRSACVLSSCSATQRP